MWRASIIKHFMVRQIIIVMKNYFDNSENGGLIWLINMKKIIYLIKLTMIKTFLGSKIPSGSRLRIQLFRTFCKILSLRSVARPRVLFCISDGVKLRTFPIKMENTNKFIPSLNIEWIENEFIMSSLAVLDIFYWPHRSDFLTCSGKGCNSTQWNLFDDTSWARC